ncbi:MAG: hypothetical protein ABIB47_03785 [Candidatus Woesearchaeota archaeon]
MKDKNFVIGFIFFIFVIFLFNSYFGVTGKQVGGRYCEDSDNGIMIYTAGRVFSDIGTFNDRCFENLNEIREYYCTEGRYGGEYQVENRVSSCGVGYRCVKDISGDSDACMLL